MRAFAGLFGWIAVWGFILLLCNYFVKFGYRKFISHLPTEKKRWKDRYMKVMRLVVKWHKPVGMMTAVAAILHALLMFYFVRLSGTGLVALGILLAAAALGGYGAYLHKKHVFAWLKIHRILAFAVVVFVCLHLLKP